VVLVVVVPEQKRRGMQSSGRRVHSHQGLQPAAGMGTTLKVPAPWPTYWY
jgi:hypothetical protein